MNKFTTNTAVELASEKPKQDTLVKVLLGVVFVFVLVAFVQCCASFQKFRQNSALIETLSKPVYEDIGLETMPVVEVETKQGEIRESTDPKAYFTYLQKMAEEEASNLLNLNRRSKFMRGMSRVPLKSEESEKELKDVVEKLEKSEKEENSNQVN